MIIIYVKKSWLDEIASEHFMVGDRANELVRLYASKIDLVYPFVLADIARSEEGKHREMFLPSHIPVDVVRGIFDDRGGKEEAGILQRFRILSDRVVNLSLSTPPAPRLIETETRSRLLGLLAKNAGNNRLTDMEKSRYRIRGLLCSIPRIPLTFF
jgi:hypothetical protein